MKINELAKLFDNGNTEEILKHFEATDIGQGYGYKDFNFDWKNGDPEKIIYIPEYGYEENGLPELESCYTKNMFLELCGNNKEAMNLFNGVDWQYPETLYDEYKREDD